MSNMPFPQPGNGHPPENEGSIVKQLKPEPWQVTSANEVEIPIYFALHYCNGEQVNYAYSDLREMRLVDAGHLELSVWGFEKYRISIVGRRLQGLVEQLGKGKVKVIREGTGGPFLRTEEEPMIDTITVDTLTGPAM